MPNHNCRSRIWQNGLNQVFVKKGALFVLRVRSEVFITTAKGKRIKLQRYLLKPDCPVWFKRISYRSDSEVGGINLAGVVAVGSDDPWWLVTNLTTPHSTIARYELRFQVEEWFKDLKHQLRIANLQTKSLKRIRRLLLIAVIAYGLLLLTGKLAKRFTKWFDWLITGRNKSASVIWLAIHIIKAELAPTKFWYQVWGKALTRASP